jgi:hypothetical protein
MLPINLIGANGLLPLGRNQPVRKNLRRIEPRRPVLSRIQLNDIVTVDQMRIAPCCTRRSARQVGPLFSR